MTSNSPPSRDSWFTWLLVLIGAIGLTVVFWGDLWKGGTLIGGDTFSYYYPQKLFLADSLQRGEIPLWNPLVGAGYPVIAESQTGVLYPPTLLLHGLFSTHTAYDANQILHYVMAFLGMWLVARRYQISRLGAGLTALVYVYGWFPSRICLEWAIIGGAYLPWLIWIVEGWLSSRRLGELVWLAPVLAMMLLAGHFHMAFLATLGLGIYVVLRLWPDSRQSIRNSLRQVSVVGGVLIAGYLLASIQLLPTAELAQRSQRQDFQNGNDPGYGHIPPWYLSQMLSLWMWYGPDSDPDQALYHVGPYAYPVNTNKVEAHLYFGMLPLLLFVLSGVLCVVQRRWPWSREVRLWLIVGGIGLGLAIGWPYVLLKHVPGFSFFRGAGRNSVLTSLAVAIAAGAAWDHVMSRLTRRSVTGVALWLVVMGLTTWEFSVVSRWVTYATVLPVPLLDERANSGISQYLHTAKQPVRLWSPGANAATLLGDSCWPVYLGLGPEEYFDPKLMSSYHEEQDAHDPVAIERHVEWLRRNGVTHLISMAPLNADVWPVREVWRGFDLLMSRVWGLGDAPLIVYELKDAPGLVVDHAGRALPLQNWSDTANTRSFDVECPEPTTVELRELNYPGWQVTVDGHPATPESDEGIYRRVQVPRGTHHIEWTYRPRSFQLGAILSALTLLLWLVLWWRSRGTASSPPSPNSTR